MKTGTTILLEMGLGGVAGATRRPANDALPFIARRLPRPTARVPVRWKVSQQAFTRSETRTPQSA